MMKLPAKQLKDDFFMVFKITRKWSYKMVVGYISFIKDERSELLLHVFAKFRAHLKVKVIQKYPCGYKDGRKQQQTTKTARKNKAHSIHPTCKPD